MLIKDCKGCKFLYWGIGVGQGVRCFHSQHRIEETSMPPIISKLSDCKLYVRRETSADAISPDEDGDKAE